MPDRQTLPAIWLMSDQSMGDALWRAIERVPSGGGVVLRHHRSDLAFAKRVAAACRERGLMLAVAGDVVLAREIGAPMVHNPGAKALGFEQALLLAQMSGAPAIALGGMDEKTGNDAIRAGFHGWAAIRAWSEGPLLPS
jgi:thiamine-phosphate pyrophosphorylase